MRVLPLFLGCLAVASAQPTRGSVLWPIPPETVITAINVSWHDGCPVAIGDLALLTIPYWNDAMEYTEGQLVIHHTIAEEVLDIFQEIFMQRYRIALMVPVAAFGANDTLSMLHNNTSGFNCRAKTGSTDEFSLHSYGCAIDLNPFTNPYQCGPVVTPPGSEPYLNRSADNPAYITPDGPIRNFFLRRGWNWGGEWITRQDYQHFQKDRFCDMILLP